MPSPIAMFRHLLPYKPLHRNHYDIGSFGLTHNHLSGSAQYTFALKIGISLKENESGHSEPIEIFG